MEKNCSHCHSNKDLLKYSKSKYGQWYMCRNCNREKAAAYRKTKNGKLRTRMAVYKSISKYQKRQNARAKVHRAIKSGKLLKPGECSNCKLGGRTIEAHHVDYKKPLDVVWLCRSCHVMV